MRRVLIVGAALALLFAILSPSVANAATRSASDCLRMFDRDIDGYYRDKWDADHVASAVGANGTTYFLRCGNELSGIIHTAHAESTGSVHPVNSNGSEDGAVAACFRKTVESGTLELQRDGRHRYLRFYGQSGGKSYVYADQQGLTYTVYTNLGGQGNDWVACSR